MSDADATTDTDGDPTDGVDLSDLATFLRETGADGYLVDDDSSTAAQRYLSGFVAHDPFVTLYTPAGTHLLVSGLEYGRAQSESRADAVHRHADYDYRAKAEEHGATTAKRLVLGEFLDGIAPEGEGGGVESVVVPDRFPLGTADALREQGVTVRTDGDDVVAGIRATKTDREIAAIRDAQAVNETALSAAEDLLRAATADDDGVLHHDGAVLTSERVKFAIESALLAEGYALEDTIVACGADGADPHDDGSGPLVANEPIVIDVFPESKTTGYHADMTRTFVVGEASAAVRSRHERTLEAMDAAFDVLGPGVTGAAVHDAVCDVYEAAGYDTFRSNPEAETGFIHSTGHGVGLDVHEAPSLSPRGDELEPGHVVTVEPGLYDPAHGGMRVEDIAVVTEDGHENLTDYHTDLEIPLD